MANDPTVTLISHYKDWEGAKVLQILLQNPNTSIPASVLQISITLRISPNEAAKTLHHASSIPMTDEITLRAIDARMNQLLSMKATALSLNPDAVTKAWDSELSQLIKYRKETTRPYGGIKYFNDDDRMAYRRFNAALRRVLQRAEQDGHHEAVAIIKRNLHQGLRMLWNS